MAAHRIRLLALTTLVAILALATGTAHAQSTAVAPFSGRRSRALQRLVERALRDRTDVVSTREVRRAARSADVSGIEPGGVPALASEVGADMVVQGQAGGSRRRPAARLVFRAADGTELARGDVEYRRGGRGARQFADEVAALYDSAAAALEAHRAPPPEPEPPPEPIDTLPVEPEPPPAEVPQDGLALFSVVAGLVIRTRDATIDLADGGRRRYELQSGVYPEILLAAEGRPFANDAHLGRGLFVRGAFAHSIGLSSQGAAGSVTTNFVRFAFDAGWLAPIGDMVELGLAFGGGYDGYHLGPNDVMGTAEYGYLRPGARARFRLAQETFVVEAELGYRGVLGVGAIRDQFGVDGDSHGVDVGIGVGGNLIAAMDLGFTWGVRFDWVGYFTSFEGVASEADGTSGTESSIRFTLQAGWSFR